MRITEIRLQNYRQYRDAEIQFGQHDGSDLHVFIGDNGSGKTNLLNAINWCLYGDEPHLSDASRALKRPNIAAAGDIIEEELLPVSVALDVSTKEGRSVTFQREELYRATGAEDAAPQLFAQDTEFEAIRIDNQGNSEVLMGEAADAEVRRFVPPNIREFFFFDCERLDTYFREATAENIRHGVFTLSQIDLLDRVDSHLSTVTDEMRREASSKSPQLDQANEALEDAQKALSEIETRIEECRKQIETAEDRIAYYSEQLRGKPDVEALTAERDDLQQRLARQRETSEDLLDQKARMLLELGNLLGFFPAVRETLSVIDKKREAREIPPVIESELLDKSLSEEECQVCRQHLTERAREQVLKLLEGISVSSATADTLVRMGTLLRPIERRIGELRESIQRVTRTARQTSRELDELQESLNEIDNHLTGYDEEAIAEHSQNLVKFENMRDEHRELLGKLKGEREAAKTKLKDAEEDYNTELKKMQKEQQLSKQIRFANRSLNLLREGKQTRIDAVRNHIQQRATDLFKDLIWKRGFDRITIDEDYSLGLLNERGYQCLGSVSAAERQLLVLSLTLALHDLSGFDAPLLIDTPVGRVSGSNRENFARVLSAVSGKKQTILIFTPDEYSTDVSQKLDPVARARHRIRFVEDEDAAHLEVL